MSINKEFKTYDEQIAILQSRGIKLSDQNLRGYAKIKLMHLGYYNLINGYKDLFLLPKATPSDVDAYKAGTTVNEIYALYSFDKKLRSIFLEAILPIETNIKNLIAYTFSQNYGHDNYLKYNNFNTCLKDSNQKVSSLIAEVHRQLSSKSSDPSILHYLKNYGYVPLWVLNNILTLGTVSKFYSLMKQPDKQSISRIFHIMDDELESYLFYLSSVRNFCAHGNRLYCFKNKNPLMDTKIHKALSIPRDTKGVYTYGKTDLFATVIILKTMMSKQEFSVFVKDILNSLKSLQKSLSVITENDVLKAMGFPADWYQKIK